jgi:urocanate hydratase
MAETELFQNWAQYLLTMKYLSEMTDEQTLTMYSGHPMGLFPSHKEAPRVVVTNGMVIPIILNRMIGKNECLRRITIWANDSRSYMYIGPTSTR